MNKNYNTLEEFLKDYHKEDFPSFGVTTDIIIFGISSKETDNYRMTDDKKMSILLVKRNEFPFKNMWCLPGGFVKINENLEDAPKRILKEETNLDNIYLEQLYTYGSVNRDPRMRIVSTSYLALIDKDRLNESTYENASWFDIVFLDNNNKSCEMTLSNGNEIINFKINKKLKESTTDRYSFEIDKNDSLAFDHPLVILSGLERIRNKINYTDIVFNMMPPEFTLGELQKVYEVILGKKLLDPAFRRIIANKVEKTKNVKTGEGHRPSALFKYKSN